MQVKDIVAKRLIYAIVKEVLAKQTTHSVKISPVYSRRVSERANYCIVKKSQFFRVLSKNDAFLLKVVGITPDLFDQAIRQRVRRSELKILEESAVFNMESPEDVILTKLEWDKMGGGVSNRQWGDILGVLKVQKQRLGLEYLRHWAAEIGVADLLTRAFQEAGFQ